MASSMDPSLNIEALERAILYSSISSSPSKIQSSSADLLSSISSASSLPSLETLTGLLCNGHYQSIFHIYASAEVLKPFVHFLPSPPPSSSLSSFSSSPSPPSSASSLMTSAEVDAATCYMSLVSHVRDLQTGDRDGTENPNFEHQEYEFQLFILGLAAFHIFIQVNISGPVALNVPSCPFSLLFPTLERREQNNLSPSTTESESISGKEHVWDSWAKKELLVDGCDFLGKFSLPQYLLFAQILLLPFPSLNCEEGTRKKPNLSIQNFPKRLYSRPWWASRVLIMHQRLLADLSPTIRTSLVISMRLTLEHFGDLKTLFESNWGGSWLKIEEKQMGKRIVTAAQLEAGHMEHVYGYTDFARICLDRAARACGFTYQVSGAMGYRTIHQVDPKAQMVLLTSTETNEEGDDVFSDSEGEKDDRDEINGINFQENGKVKVNNDIPELSGKESNSKLFSGESDILLKPKLLENFALGEKKDSSYTVNGTENRRLSSMEQAILLAECMAVRKNNPDDELRSWQMAPYIEAVDSQSRLKPMLKASCQLLRVRWEKLRSHTRERALSTMENLVEDIRGNENVSSRTQFAFTVWLPTWTSLQKEYGELLISFGLVGDALRIFEKIELWDSLIDCYRLLGKKAAATDLVQSRLQFHPDDPRLWCSLGDLTLDDGCYLKAWEVSGKRHSRAKRSLARRATERGAYKEAMTHWEEAFAINPLHPDGWFSYGYVCMKEKELSKARIAFSRSVQLEPDNGEAWNNIAVLNLERKNLKAAFIALQEALKYKRDNWQMWGNFTHVSLDLQNFRQAVRGITKVLDLTNDKNPDLEALSQLVEAVEVGRGRRPVMSQPPENDVTVTEESEEEEMEELFVNMHFLEFKENEKNGESEMKMEMGEDHGTGEGEKYDSTENRQREWLEREVRQLIGRVVVSGEGGSRIFGLQTRFFGAIGDRSMASEALLKQIRNLQGSKWQHSREQFIDFAEVSKQLGESYLEISEEKIKEGETASARKALAGARMHIRGVLKQAYRFEGTKEFENLTECLQKVEALEQKIKQ